VIHNFTQAAKQQEDSTSGGVEEDVGVDRVVSQRHGLLDEQAFQRSASSGWAVGMHRFEDKVNMWRSSLWDSGRGAPASPGHGHGQHLLIVVI
jgi:hypothetical protein